MKLRCLDLFAGVGGFRLGMHQAGFKTVFSNDFDKWAKVTFDANFSDPQMTLGDITKIDEKDLPEFDVLVGGFPCQAFSVIGARRGFEDKTKGTLFFDMLRIMKHHRPQMALMENVRGLLNHDKGKTFKVVLESLEELGYHVRWKLLKSSTHSGVPQMRPRVFIVSFLDKEAAERFEFPCEIPLECHFWDLLDLGEEGAESKPWLKGSLLKRTEHLFPGLVEKRIYFHRYDEGLKYIKTPGVCSTLVANIGSSQTPFVLDLGRLRYLTPREQFRLQGFPEDYVLPEELNIGKLTQQAGNSVTVPLIRRIGEQMQLAVNPELSIVSGGRQLAQSQLH